MRKSEVKETLHNVLATGRQGGNGEVRSKSCPFCGSTTKEPFQINSVTGYYYCFACGESGLCPGFFPEPRMPDSLTVSSKGLASVDPPPEFVSFSGMASRIPQAVQYITQKRKLTLELAKRWGIGCCLGGRYARRVIVPVWDAIEPTRWLGWVGRSWDNRANFPYTTPTDMDRARIIYRQWMLGVDTARPLLVGEGVFDALWAGEAVATFGKMSEPQFDLLCKAKRPIVLMYDGDARHHGYYQAMRLRLAGKQAASLGLAPAKDPDDYSREVLQEAAIHAIQSGKTEVEL